MLLRNAVCGTMIQLTAQQGEKFSSGTCLGIISEQIDNSIRVVFLGMLEVWAVFVLLVVMTALSVYLTRKTPFILPMPFVMLLIDVIVLVCRLKKQTQMFSKVIDKDNQCKDVFSEISDLRGLITAFRKGNVMEDKFAVCNREMTKLRFAADAFQRNTEKILKWNHTVWIAAVLMIGGIRAATKVMAVSDFVVVMTVMFNYDREIQRLFSLLFAAVNGYVSVNKIAALLNSPTRRKALIADRVRRKKILDDIMDRSPDFRLDPESILVYGVEFDYNAVEEEEEEEKAGEKADGLLGGDLLGGLAGAASLIPGMDGLIPPKTARPSMEDEDNMGPNDPSARLGPITLVLEQGQVVCVKSSSTASGKKTFLMLLARLFLPQSGIVHYPDKLRMRYISSEPLLFNMTLMENLRFGNIRDHSDEEIWGVCKAVGLGPEVLGKANLQVGLGGIRLSLTNRIFVCIARAFLGSVDLLFLSNMLDFIGPNAAVQIVKLLKQWRKARGLALLSKDMTRHISQQKHKTCFFISKNPKVESKSDCTLILESQFDSEKASSKLRATMKGILYGDTARLLEQWHMNFKIDKHESETSP